MEVEFMTADTVLPPCMPLPTAMLRLPISSTAKVMYARLLDATLREVRRIPTGYCLSGSPLWSWQRPCSAAP